MRDFKALERILLPAWDLAQGRRRPGAPAHKFAHANDFSGLTSSLRYFCSSSSRTARVLRRAKDEDGGRRLARCVSGVDEAKKQRKRKESFAKRNETFRGLGRKSLESLYAANQLFRGIVCFQGLNRLFISHFFRIRSPGPNGLSPAIDAVACHARESVIQLGFGETWIPTCAGMTRLPGAIPSEHRCSEGTVWT